MESIAELNDEVFDRTLASASTPVVLGFYTPWCGPCIMLAPVLEQLAERFAGRVQIFKVNAVLAPGLVVRYKITGVPTLLFVRQGEVTEVIVGFPLPRVLAEKLERLASELPEVRA